jgi:predicted signal transduction protein with EAL and GGDEF domain
LGGDEFSIILENLFDGRDAGLVAHKILEALSQHFDLDGHEVFVSSSISIAVSPPVGTMLWSGTPTLPCIAPNN